jgi:hypothetical protein
MATKQERRAWQKANGQSYNKRKDKQKKKAKE